MIIINPGRIVGLKFRFSVSQVAFAVVKIKHHFKLIAITAVA